MLDLLRRPLVTALVVATLVAIASSAVAQPPTRGRWGRMPERGTAWERSMFLGISAYRAGRLEQAEATLRVAVKEAEGFGADRIEVAEALGHLAYVHRLQQRDAEAEPLYRREIAIREKRQGPAHPDLAPALGGLGIVYVTLGLYGEAEPLLFRSVSLLEAETPRDEPRLGLAYADLGRFYTTTGRYPDAVNFFQRALALLKKASADSGAYAIVTNNFAAAYEAQDKHAEAAALYRTALGVLEHQHGAQHPNVAIAARNLGRALARQHRYAEAEPLYQRAIRTFERTLGPRHETVGRTLLEYAELLEQAGREAEATATAAQARAILDRR